MIYNFAKYFVFLLTLLLFGFACKKDSTVPFMQVTFTAPVESEVFAVPDTIWVKFHINSEQPIQNLRISIDNEQLIPLSPKVYLTPDDTTQHFNIPLVVDDLQGNASMKAYVNLLVNDGSQEDHWFLEIGLTSRPVTYKGMAVITKSQGVHSQAFFYDENGVETGQLTWQGTTTAALSVMASDLLIATTHNPDNLLAIRFEDQEWEWTKQAPLPYPEFTCLSYTYPYLYYGEGTGRIVSAFAGTGLQHNETLVFENYFSTAVTVKSDNIVFSQQSRNGETGKITTCYTATGALKYHYLTDFVAVYAEKSFSDESVILIGNKGNTGNILVFAPDLNQVVNSFEFNIGMIEKAISIDGIQFLILTKKKVFLLDLSSEIFTPKYETTVDLAGITFDAMTQQIFLSIGNEVHVLTYPSFHLDKKVTFNDPVVSVCLRYLP